MVASASGAAVGVLQDTLTGFNIVNPVQTGGAQTGGAISALTSLGVATGGLFGLYGTTPVVQRALAAQATSLVGTASSTAVNTDMKAAMIEIMNTLAALGIWKGSA